MSIEWIDNEAAVPLEKYDLKCVAFGGSCDSAGDGVPQTGILRGVQQGEVTSLSPNTRYSCYVVANNEFGDECSEDIDITTQPDSVPVAPASVTTTPVPGELFQREISWEIPNADAYQISNYTVTCISTAILTYEGSGGRVSEILSRSLVIDGNATSAIIGVGPDNELPPAGYICSVYASNVVGDGPSEESSEFSAGSTCSDTGKTESIYNGFPVVQQTANLPRVENFFPLNVWWNEDQYHSGGVAIRNLVTAPLEDYNSDSVNSTPQGSSLAVELSTTTNNPDKAGISFSGVYGNYSSLTKKSFAELIDDPAFAVKYSWFKQGPCTGACSAAAAPSVKLWLYAPGEGMPKESQKRNIAILIYEPYQNPKDVNGDPISTWSNIDTLDRWYTVDINKNDGGSSVDGTTNQRGWWMSTSGWQGFGSQAAQEKRYSLQAWYDYFSSLDSDAANTIEIVKIQVQVGSYNTGLTTFTNDIAITYTDSTTVSVPSCRIDLA